MAMRRTARGESLRDWSNDIHGVLAASNVSLIATVPDAGLSRTLDLCRKDGKMHVVTLSSEQDGIGILIGAWLGGKRAALLMQSSGVGNCVNAFATIAACRTPCLMLVTMRGEWGEFNPWQVPMGQAAPKVMEIMGTVLHRADRAEDVGPAMTAAAAIAFNSERAAAVLIGQRLIGTKSFDK